LISTKRRINNPSGRELKVKFLRTVSCILLQNINISQAGPIQHTGRKSEAQAANIYKKGYAS